MYRVPTIAEFELLYARLKEICVEFPEATGNFLDWYCVKRTHLFPAFRPGRHSGLKVAKVGTTMWE